MKNANNYYIRYVQDLEDQFKLDCTEEDIKTDKEANKCAKTIRKIKRQTRAYHKFLAEQDVVSDYDISYNSRRYSNLTYIGCVMIFVSLVALIVCLTIDGVLYFQNPDMTALRRMITYPVPTIVESVSIILMVIGRVLLNEDMHR